MPGPHRYPVIGLATALALSACVVTPTKPRLAPTTRPATVAVASTAPNQPLPAWLATAGTVTLAQAGGQTLASASLTGKVKAPAALVSNNGGTVISNNGSTIVSDNGGALVGKTRRRLLTVVSQAPVPGARLFVLDAAGHAVVDANGRPVTATADATGSYTLAGVGFTHNMILAADIGAGVERALLPAGASAPIDVDLVSALATTYILDRYVSPQASPVQVLDRLSAELDGRTRVSAGKAVETGDVPVPGRLAAGDLDATVEALRHQDPAFDQQMETVRKTLLAAGQSDLGNGLRGTAVSLAGIKHLAAAADGGVLFDAEPAANTNRVWHLTPDGALEAVAGVGTETGATFDRNQPGQRVEAAKMSVFNVSGLALDGAGRPLVVDYDGSRAFRVESGGQATILETTDFMSRRVVALAAGHGDDVFLVERGLDGSASVVHWQPDGATTAPLPLAGPAAALFAPFRPVWGTAGGKVYAGAADGTVTRLEPATGGSEPTGLAGRVDAAGNVWSADKASWSVHTPDGRTVAVTLPAGVDEASTLLLPDGDAIATRDGSRLYRIHQGVASLVAGQESAGGTDNVTGGLVRPNSAVVGADGALYVLDAGAGTVVRVAADRSTTAIASGLANPAALRVDAKGNLYLLADGAGGRTPLELPTGAPAATPVALPPLPAASGGHDSAMDLAVAPDGTVYACAGGNLYRLAGGTYEAIATGDLAVHMIATDAAGQLWAYGLVWQGMLPGDAVLARVGSDGKLARWSGVKSPLALNPAGLAVDAAGRVYIGITGLQGMMPAGVIRVEAPDTPAVLVAGQGGKVLAGTTADDGLSNVAAVAIAPNGDLLVTDDASRQVKRVPAAKL